jgi:hypothetical protein
MAAGWELKLGRLRVGEIVAAVSALALFVVMFGSWYGLGGGPTVERLIARGGVDTTFNAWQSFDVLDVYLLVTILVAVMLAVLTASQRSSALPVAAGVITTVLGLLASLLVVIRLLDQPGDNEFIDVKLGAYLGLLAALGVAIGGFLSMRDEGAGLREHGGGSPPAPGAELRPSPPPAGASHAPPAGASAPPPGASA